MPGFGVRKHETRSATLFRSVGVELAIFVVTLSVAFIFRPYSLAADCAACFMMPRTKVDRQTDRQADRDRETNSSTD